MLSKLVRSLLCFLLLSTSLLSAKTVQDMFNVFEDKEGNLLLVRKSTSENPKRPFANLLSPFNRKWMYNSPIKSWDGDLQLGLGFAVGYSAIPDQFFETTYNGQTGQFGQVYDGSETVTRNNGVQFGVNLELRILDRLKIGTDLDFHIRDKEDEDGYINIGNGGWTPVGDRVSTIASQGETLGELLMNSYSLYSEVDVIAIPIKKTNFILSPGFFYKKIGTAHYASISHVQDDHQNDMGVRFSITPTKVSQKNHAEVLPVRLNFEFGFQGTKALKLVLFI